MASTNLPVGTIIDAPAIDELPHYIKQYPNLASLHLGTRVVLCTDEFFADAQRMLQDAEPIFIVGKFDEHGKWMDGWETRRRRNGGNDHAIIKLGSPGVIKGLDIDTSHFTGNFPPAASIQAASCSGDPDSQTEWVEIVPVRSLQGNSHHFVKIDDTRVWTHLRLNIFPDGGIARLRVHGQPACDWGQRESGDLHEVSALVNGGRIVACNDAHFGSPTNVIKAGRGKDMGDGWETRRRREPGNDWLILALGHPAIVEKIEIDTAHFKGNYPDRVSLQGALVPESTDQSLITQAMFWPTILTEQKTEMDAQHFYAGQDIIPVGPVSHVRVNIFPDGGVSRVRIWGRLVTT